MIQNGIADLVGHLVGVAHGNGFAREKISVRVHGKVLVLGKAVALPSILPHLSGDSDVRALSFPLTALILLAMGLGLGAIGSGLTIRRFLQV